MFDIGFSELVVIGLIGLVVLGPKRLPEVARTAGRWLGKLRRFVSDVKQDLDREVNAAELAELRKLRDELNSTRRLMQDTSTDLVRGFSEISHEPQAPSLPTPSTQPEPPKLPRTRPKPRSRKKHGRRPKSRGR